MNSVEQRKIIGKFVVVIIAVFLAILRTVLVLPVPG